MLPTNRKGNLGGSIDFASFTWNNTYWPFHLTSLILTQYETILSIHESRNHLNNNIKENMCNPGHWCVQQDVPADTAFAKLTAVNHQADLVEMISPVVYYFRGFPGFAKTYRPKRDNNYFDFRRKISHHKKYFHK